MQPDPIQQRADHGPPSEAGGMPRGVGASPGVDRAELAEEISLMSSAAQQFVDTFDFEAARRFIEARSRQVRIEVRVHALSLGVLAIAGVAQHVARKPDALLAFDQTDGLLLVVAGLVGAGALGRLRVLASVRAAAPSEGGDDLRPVVTREAARVRRERVWGAAATILATLALVVGGIDALVDGAWLFAAGYAGLAVGCGLFTRRLVGRRAEARAERYIAGGMDEVAYVRGKDQVSED